MSPGDYRREYAAYCMALARARYGFHTGRAPQLNLAPLRERYADLWTRERPRELEQAWHETPAQFETERAALRRLVNIARLGYATVETREVADELASCEAAARITWAGARVAATGAHDLLANETDAARRRELGARYADALRACDDLRAARLDALNMAAAALDFNSYFALLDEATQTDSQQITTAADALLARTGDAYRARLRAWAARHLPPTHAPVYADSLFFARLAGLDQLF